MRARMYNELAELWPRLSPPERYRDEAGRLGRLFARELGPGPLRLLALGSGGGHLVWNLSSSYQITAVDLSEAMLEVSRRLNPEVRHLCADMRCLQIEERFEVVLLHDAAAYLLHRDELVQTLTVAAGHLAPGGIVAVVPDYVQETYPGDHLAHHPCGDGVEVLEWCRRTGSERLETVFVFLFREGHGLRSLTDLHQMGLFSERTWLEAMGEAGFEARRPRNLQGRAGQGAYLFSGRLMNVRGKQ